MTLPSRRKHRITRPNTTAPTPPDRRLGGGVASAALASVGLLLGLLLTPTALAAEPARRGTDMLDALKHRDPAAAWAATAPPVPPAAPVPQAPVPQAPAAGPAWRPAAPDPSAFAPVGPGFVPAVSEPVAFQPDPLQPVPDDVPYGPEGERATDRGAGDELDPDAYDGLLPGVKPIARTPDQLRKIGEIRPFWDYEPDADVDDPCLYLCPRPDGLPCKQYGPDERVPACPEEVTLGSEPFVPRTIPPSCYAWAASNINYNPLYFEDVALERYGHNFGPIQPAASLGLFGFQLIGLPYQMALDPPCKRVYPLGYYRPGEPAPKLIYQVPLNVKAAAVTAGFYSGVGVILP